MKKEEGSTRPDPVGRRIYWWHELGRVAARQSTKRQLSEDDDQRAIYLSDGVNGLMRKYNIWRFTTRSTMPPIVFQNVGNNIFNNRGNYNSRYTSNYNFQNNDNYNFPKC